MSKGRLLIVEDEPDISNMLRIYFEGQDFEVETALRGGEALEMTRQKLPHLIILDILLPDIDGFEVCKILRSSVRTSHVPIIFLTQKDERSDKLQGLELGVDDYITKPFDIEEVRLRVQRAITRAEQQSLTDPRSGLPSGRLIEEQLRRIIHTKSWSLLDVRIKDFDGFVDVYGFVAGDNVLRFVAMLLNEIVDEFGTPEDFIGHAVGDNFIVITVEDVASSINEQLKRRFSNEVLSHYSTIDQEQGYIIAKGSGGRDQKISLMTIAIGEANSTQYEYADIREITKVAAQARRQGG